MSAFTQVYSKDVSMCHIKFKWNLSLAIKHTEILYFTVYVNYKILQRQWGNKHKWYNQKDREKFTFLWRYSTSLNLFFSVVPHPVWTLFHTASSSRAPEKNLSYNSVSSRIFETKPLQPIHFTSFECLLLHPAVKSPPLPDTDSWGFFLERQASFQNTFSL